MTPLSIKRLFARTAAADPESRAPATPVRNPLLYIDDDPATRSQSRVLISALGAAVPNREDQLLGVAAAIVAGGQRPVLAATHLSTAFLVAQRHPVEIVPMRADLHALSDSEYASYLRRRWTLILAKWAITEAIDLGLEFDLFLADQIPAETA